MAAGQEKRKKRKKKLREGDEVKAGTKADSFYSILAPSCNHPVRGCFFFLLSCTLHSGYRPSDLAAAVKRGWRLGTGVFSHDKRLSLGEKG